MQNLRHTAVSRLKLRYDSKAKFADVAELVDALDLGSSTARCEGSSPFVRILSQIVERNPSPSDGKVEVATNLLRRFY